jgi:hypothetical protein
VGDLLGEGELGPVGRGTSVSARPPGWGRVEEHAIGADPAQDLDRQVGQQPRQPGDVVAGVEHDQDVGIAWFVLARGGEAFDDAADLGRGHHGCLLASGKTVENETRNPARQSGSGKRVAWPGSNAWGTIEPTATAVFFRIFGRNLQIMKRWPPHVTATRRP